jgi:hypothetical protein
MLNIKTKFSAQRGVSDIWEFAQRYAAPLKTRELILTEVEKDEAEKV